MWFRPNTVRLRKPHAEQARFIGSPAKRKIVRAGRRSGKTVGCAILSVQEFLRGKRILYVAPTEEQTGAFWAEVRRALGPLVAEGVFRKSESEQYIEKPDSAQRIRATTSWDPNSLRSDWCDLLILDEWQLQAEEMWSEVGAPMMLDRDGGAVFVYTPPSLHARAISKAHDPRHAAKLFKLASLDKSGRWAAFTFTSHANPYISRKALAEIAQDMTRLAYRQEIEAEDSEQIQGALWTQKNIDENRVEAAPELTRIVVGIDPSGSSRATADECGIVVGGLGADGHGYVLRDLSGRMSPEKWAGISVGAYHEFKADRIVAEQNFGGEMVALTLQGVDPNVAYKSVVASRGKLVRAEPISAKYEQHRIHHAGTFPDLEDELCSYTGTGASPGRLDALVWTLTELLLGDETFGLVEYFKSGGAARELAKLENPARPAPMVTRLPSSPGPEALPGACPACKSQCVIRAATAGGWHCNQCSHDFGSLKPQVTYAGFAGIFRR